MHHEQAGEQEKRDCQQREAVDPRHHALRDHHQRQYIADQQISDRGKRKRDRDRRIDEEQENEDGKEDEKGKAHLRSSAATRATKAMAPVTGSAR